MRPRLAATLALAAALAAAAPAGVAQDTAPRDPERAAQATAPPDPERLAEEPAPAKPDARMDEQAPAEPSPTMHGQPPTPRGEDDARERPSPSRREPAGASQAALAETLARWDGETRRAREVIEDDVASNQALDIMRDRLLALRDEARDLAARQRAAAEPLQRELNALGPAPEDGEEDAEVAALRADLARRIAEITAPAQQAQASAERFAVLIEDLTELQRERLRSRVLTRGPSPLNPEIWGNGLKQLLGLEEEIGDEVRTIVANPASRALAAERAPLAALALLASVVVMVFGRQRVGRWVARVGRDPSVSRQRKLATAIAATLARAALPFAAVFLFFFAVVAVGLVGPKVEAILGGIGRGALFVVATYALSAAFYAPEAPELRLARLDDRLARRARKAVMALGWVAGLGSAIVFTLTRLRFDPASLIVLNFVLTLVASWALLRLRSVYLQADAAEAESHAADSEGMEDDPNVLARQARRAVLLLIGAVALIAPALSALGYLAASYELLGPSIRSLGVLGLGVMGYALAVEVSHGAAEAAGERGASRFFRLLPLIAATLLTIAAIPLLAMAWGATPSDVGYAAAAFFDGYEVSGVRVSPVGFVTFLGVFLAGYALTGAVRRIMRGSVLPQLQMDPGARSALDSGLGYLGVILAGLIAISAAGLDLSNLAIVAGALSVGVGFGLQTIVNNFVSGLILLMERPIQTGDWIEVNGVHGTVKKINVRSTEIETFDRSAYIVPNSDLISAPVTNYTHRSVLGRLIIKVGVSYASDPRQVETILREVAQAHPMVLKRPPPAILFHAFGADALEFEVRAYLRDVNFILSVGSDLHFAIAERFRAEGVEIPFGQRDIWLRNPEKLAEALGGAAAGRAGALRAAEAPDRAAAAGAEALHAAAETAEPRPAAGETDKAAAGLGAARTGGHA